MYRCMHTCMFTRMALYAYVWSCMIMYDNYGSACVCMVMSCHVT